MDSTDLPVSRQADIVGIEIEEYFVIREEILAWLEINLPDQMERLTDTRLSEVVPDGWSVRCARCSRVIEYVPCISCLAESGKIPGMDDDMNAKPRRPRRPTTHLPGTAAKLRVMRDRASRGQSIFHPDDPVIFCQHIPRHLLDDHA